MKLAAKKLADYQALGLDKKLQECQERVLNLTETLSREKDILQRKVALNTAARAKHESLA